MIVFDLGCDGGHIFEAWFGSTEDYEAQRGRGLVSCPICASSVIDKAAMAPRLARKGNQTLGAPVPIASNTTPEAAKAMMQKLSQAQAEMLKSSDYVGPRFADEARAMYLGDKEHRTIHGQTTPDEAQALIEEGVPVAPLPFPVRPPGADN